MRRVHHILGILKTFFFIHLSHFSIVANKMFTSWLQCQPKYYWNQARHKSQILYLFWLNIYLRRLRRKWVLNLTNFEPFQSKCNKNFLLKIGTHGVSTKAFNCSFHYLLWHQTNFLSRPIKLGPKALIVLSG